MGFQRDPVETIDGQSGDLLDQRIQRLVIQALGRFDDLFEVTDFATILEDGGRERVVQIERCQDFFQWQTKEHTKQ